MRAVRGWAHCDWFCVSVDVRCAGFRLALAPRPRPESASGRAARRPGRRAGTRGGRQRSLTHTEEECVSGRRVCSGREADLTVLCKRLGEDLAGVGVRKVRKETERSRSNLPETFTMGMYSQCQKETAWQPEKRETETEKISRGRVAAEDQSSTDGDDTMKGS